MKKYLAILFILVFTNIGHANFTDVKWDTLYKDGINLLQENQIVKGYSDGSFGVNKNISRSEMLKILVESKFLIEDKQTTELDEYQNQNCFEDVNQNDWFAKYVCWAKDNQWRRKVLNPWIMGLSCSPKLRGFSYRENACIIFVIWHNQCTRHRRIAR